MGWNKGDDEMIKALIENYETLTVVGVFTIAMVWYLWYQTRRQSKREDKQDEERAERQKKHDEDQKEERDYYRGLITNDQKKNVDLNVQGIALQKEMMKEMKDHDNYSREAWKNLNGSLTAICNRLNGNTLKKKVKKTDEKKG